ncbi:FtsX-like permease family protein [Jeotgalibaca dankookensis]|uniref:FtsX-like permease family protein n=1 Tax=Jeotgalibaca dankookensis TaxID=708126 RepID=UPI0007845269|nr:FtsX-like permease family protein [Jeotgalibaca dankookensis]
MKKKALWKDIWKGIWNNKASFLALLAIIMLGTGFFGGISATGPIMLKTADHYYKNLDFYDLKVLSTYGIEDKDVAILNNVDGVTSEPTQSIDLVMEEHEFATRLFTHDSDSQLNDYEIISGRLPNQPGEIALDSELASSEDGIALGNQVTFKQSSEEGLELADHEYEIVGFVNTPIYIEKTSRGNTQAATGSLDGFGVIHPDDLTGDLFTEIYVAFDKEYPAYSDDYKNQVSNKKKEIEEALNGRPLERVNEIRKEGREEIFKAETELEDAKEEINKAKKTLEDSRKELVEAKETYEENETAFQNEIKEAEDEIAKQQAVLDDGYAEYENGLAEWQEGMAAYEEAKANWQGQRAALLEQLNTTLTLEGLAQNPIPTPEGEQLATQVKDLFSAEAEINEAREQLQTLPDAFANQKAELDAAKSQLEQSEEELKNAEQEIQSRIGSLAERQAQLAYIQEQVQIPYGDLTEEQKAEMLASVSAQGEQTLVYQPFIRYLNGELLATAIPFTEEIAYQNESETIIENAQADLKVQNDRLQEGYETIIQSEQALEEAQVEYQNNLQELETRAQEIQAAKEAVLNQVQGSLQMIEAQIQAADSQFEEQGAQLAAAKSELDAAKQELDAGQAELTAGSNQLAEEKAEGQAALDEALEKIQSGEEEYQEGLETFEEETKDAQEEIEKAEKELAEAKEELAELEEPTYFVQGRSDNPGYSGFGDNADRISSIASIFPVFFFLIAALVSFTTMTRMVDEQRTQIGTLKGLGYSNFDIAKKFLVYAAVAGIVGTAIGLIAGYRLFPLLIFNAYNSLYNFPDIQFDTYPLYTIIAIIVAILCTVGPAAIASYRTLKEEPASIMRPKAPKMGKRVFLERLPFIWNRLGFNAKVTVRNLVRYKIRNSMTIIGVAGSMALILTGFAIRDSISSLAETQFNEIIKYDMVVALQDERSDEDLTNYEAIRDGYAEIDSHMYALQANYKVEKSGLNTQDVTVFVPNDSENILDFVSLNERGETQSHSLTDDGAIISEKLASMMAVGPGDELVIQDEEEMTYTVPISQVTENYTGHYLYLTEDLYGSVFSERFSPNTDLIRYEGGGKWESEFAERAMQEDAIALVTFIAQINKAFEETLNSLDVITLVLIISAAALAFVVLYNLTNINVSERIRELSTIKVLGFYDLEVSLYIYRETFILTLIGILFGFGLGSYLGNVLLKMVEIDLMLFPVIIKPLSYLSSALLTLLFSIVVMVIMHLKLKRVDMIEALKSVE